MSSDVSFTMFRESSENITGRLEAFLIFNCKNYAMLISLGAVCQLLEYPISKSWEVLPGESNDNPDIFQMKLQQFLIPQ